ncbi:MAG: hypothetical protein QME79_09895, partial [Bacillota bacterium]|nr:hypothetical protein [Bacillota bacterium]
MKPAGRGAAGSRWTAAVAGAAGVVGAGFASGREAAVFFAPYGVWGLVGLALAVLLAGRTASRPLRVLAAPWQSAWLLLLWVTLAATLAAGGEVLHHLLGWPVEAGAATLGALAAAVPGRAGVQRLQGATVLLLAGAILLVGGAAGARAGAGLGSVERWAFLPGIAAAETARGPLGALLAALLYASYTSALMTGGANAGGGRRPDAWPGATLVGLLLTVMVRALHCSPGAGRAPLPMLAVAAGWGAGAARAYACLLGVAAANAALAT